MSDNPNVVAVYYQPPSEGVEECVTIELHGGAKTFMRVWPAALDVGIEWGWKVHETAEKIYGAP